MNFVAFLFLFVIAIAKKSVRSKKLRGFSVSPQVVRSTMPFSGYSFGFWFGSTSGYVIISVSQLVFLFWYLHVEWKKKKVETKEWEVQQRETARALTLVDLPCHPNSSCWDSRILSIMQKREYTIPVGDGMEYGLYYCVLLLLLCINNWNRQDRSA